MYILYRTAESKNKNNKNKPDYINNKNCLENIYKNKGEAKLIVFGDRLEPDTKTHAINHCDEFIEIKNHGNSESFKEVFNYAIDHYKGDEITYFIEDDYLHRSGFEDIVREGLDRADYVSLYDHPDKYGVQPEILFHTKSTHWKFTHSTTMTFAAYINTLIEDYAIWDEMVTTGTPPDHYIFMKLFNLKRRLATPIPGYSTHGETEFLAPVIKWEDYV